MRKNAMVFTLCAAMTLSMTGCGNDNKETAAPGTKAAESGAVEETASAPADEAMIALASEGMVTMIECEPIELSLGCSGTVEGTIMGDSIAAAIEAVNTWTNGNFVVNFYPGGQLGGDVELIEGTQMGSVDMFTGAPTSQIGLIQELAVLDIGGLYADVESANQVLQSFKGQLEPYYNDAGLHLVSMFAPDFRILSTNKPVTTAADLKGLNIRTQENKYHMAFWKALGTNPTPLAFGELYIALQQGMLDAQENPWASIVGAKLCEVQKYVVETNHIPFVSTYVMNKAKYDSMSDAQKLACDQFALFCERYQMAGTADDNARMSKLCQTDFGIQVTPVSDELRALYSDASLAVIDMMKENIEPAFVDSYVAAARAAGN